MSLLHTHSQLQNDWGTRLSSSCALSYQVGRSLDGRGEPVTSFNGPMGTVAKRPDNGGKGKPARIQTKNQAFLAEVTP